MKIRKNALMLALIGSLLMSTAVLLSHAGTMTTLAIEPSEIVTTEPFSIDITVDDVVEMLNYQFSVSYDTNVLTATSFFFYPPFTEEMGEEGGWIDDEAGYVLLAFSMPPGELYGFTTDEPFAIAGIDFTVDAPGASPLSIDGTPGLPPPYDVSVVSDIHGEPISHVALRGEFATELGLPIASFYCMPETPIVGDRVTFTSTSTDADGYITDWNWDCGDGDTATGETVTHRYTAEEDYTVTLTVTDNDGKTDSQSATITVVPKPVPEGVELRNSKVTYRRFSVSERDPATINTFTAWVKSLNPKQPTDVRIVWSIWGPGMTPLGGMEATGTIAPKELAKFTADFDVFDARWEYEGERMDYEVRTEVYYGPANPPPEWAPGTIAGEPGTEWFSVTTLP